MGQKDNTMLTFLLFEFVLLYFKIFKSSYVALHSSLHAAEATHCTSSSHHPTGGSHLRPERVRGATHDCKGKKSPGQIQAALG